jgi:hypothetical protein
LPDASVVRAFEPEQEVRVETAIPPPDMVSPPAIVEVEVSEVTLRRFVARPPVKVEVPAPLFMRLPLRVRPEVERSEEALRPAKVEVAVDEVAVNLSATTSPPITRAAIPEVVAMFSDPLIVEVERFETVRFFRVEVPETKFPVTVKSLLTDDEAKETKPPYCVSSPATARVEDAESARPTVKIPAMDEVVAVEVERKFETSR